MPVTAVRRKYYSHNGAYGIVMRGVQKMNTRVHRYEGTNFKSLQRINLDTATDSCNGHGYFLNKC